MKSKKIFKASYTVLLNVLFFSIIVYAVLFSGHPYHNYAENFVYFYIPANCILTLLLALGKNGIPEEHKPTRGAGKFIPKFFDFLIIILFATNAWYWFAVMQVIQTIAEASIFDIDNKTTEVDETIKNIQNEILNNAEDES